MWREAEQYLLEFDEWCRSHDVPWVLTLIPAEVQVDEAVRETVIQRLSLRSEEYDFDLPQLRLRQFAETHRIICLDLLPAMRAAHRPEGRLYIPNDTHWNKRGNRIAADTITTFLIEQDLFDD
jgi:hypothetical protein